MEKILFAAAVSFSQSRSLFLLLCEINVDFLLAELKIAFFTFFSNRLLKPNDRMLIQFFSLLGEGWWVLKASHCQIKFIILQAC